MPILNKLNKKAKYVLSLIDGKEYCKSTGKFKMHLRMHNLTEEGYVEKYEGGTPLICVHCGTRHQFDGGTWQWAKMCRVQKCEGSTWRHNWANRSEEAKIRHSVNSGAWRNDPVKKAETAKIVHLANLKVGEDGLTGYERTRLKREEILEKRTGNKYPTGQWSTATSEKRKWQGERIKKGVLKKHGVEYIMQVPEILEKQKKTLNRPAERKRRSEQMIKQLETMTLGYSKVSQAFFHQLQELLHNAARFFENGGEVKVGIYALDFCLGAKAIEFNGDWWHANPAIYEANEILSHFDQKRTAKSIWERDAKRLEFIRSKGYEVKVVWESDFRKNPEQTVKDCLSWLNESK